MDQIQRLAQKIEELHNECQGIRDRAANEGGRDFSPEECEALDQKIALIDQYTADRQRLETILENERQLQAAKSRQAEPQNAPQQKPQASEPQARKTRIEPVRTAYDRGQWSFQNFGEYLKAVISSSGKGNPVDQRLIVNAPTTYGTEGSGPDGGFAVPPDFRSEIGQLIQGESSLLAMTDQMTSSSNTFTVPTDETTPWQTTGGILTYWTGEAGSLTESKPALKEMTLKLHKLTCLVPVSEELIQDAPAMESYIGRKAAEKITMEINRVIIHGTGAGQPLGLLKSDALVSITKDTNQTADTVTFNNIVRMWSRCYGPVRNRAVWLVNQDVEPQILSLVVTSAYQSAYMPAGGLSGSQYSTLFGRPIIPTQACETLGDKGDIFLADLKSYLTVSRSMRQDSSIHLYFDYDVMAFRFILRVAGQPWWSTYGTPRDGSSYFSPFVCIDERA